jgi:hypothetical protein
MQQPCTTLQQQCLPLAWSWGQQQVDRLCLRCHTAQVQVVLLQQLVAQQQQQEVVMAMVQVQHQQQLVQQQQEACQVAWSQDSTMATHQACLQQLRHCSLRAWRRLAGVTPPTSMLPSL